MSTFNTPGQWIAQISGQPETPVDTYTLAAWAKQKVITPQTQVYEVSTGKIYQASQIAGVFSEKEFLVAILFSVFLGSLGIDRFYLGHVGLGIGKLLTCGGCGIWQLVDIILIAMRNVNDSNGLPLK
jgi:TM2 domain-containing membrane protein YozV